MLKLANFKNKHQGKDIYVIASGKSGDFIDPSFFDNKITVGVNQVYKKFKTTYLVRKESNHLNSVLQNSNKSTIHFISNGNMGMPDNRNLTNIKNKKLFEKAPICCFPHPGNTMRDIKPVPEGQLVCSYSTITTAIHLAAHMGASNIILLGHDCGSIDNESNFKGYHSGGTRLQKSDVQYKNWLKEIEGQTIKLKKILKDKYGCNIYSLNPFVNFGLEGHTYTR